MKSNKRFNFQNNKGAGAIIMALVVLGIVGGSIVYKMNLGDISTKITAETIKDVNARIEAQKILAQAGFYIANNIILCKQSNSGSLCSFNKNHPAIAKIAVEDLKQYSFLGHQKGDKFDWRKANVNPYNYKGDISFTLIDSRNDPKINITETKADKDPYFVKVTLKLKVPISKSSNRTKEILSEIAYRRPIAIPDFKVLSSSCAYQCIASLNTNNPNPPCRGEFKADTASTYAITGKLTNHGPGVLYGVSLFRSAKYMGETKVDTGLVSVLENGILMPNNTIEWSDKIKCKTISATKTISDNNRNSISNLILPSAIAQNRSTRREVSQHSQAVGDLKYSLGQNSMLEPNRINEDLSSKSSTSVGIKAQKITNVKLRIIPPH